MHIVSGDPLFARMIQIVLENAGYQQITVSSKTNRKYDLAVIDLDAFPEPPQADQCITFSRMQGCGADLIRPFKTDELVALAGERFGTPTHAHARRGNSDAPGSRRESFSAEITVSEPDGITVNGVRIGLSPKEYRLFLVLLSNRGKTVSKEVLHSSVFDGCEGNSIEVYISYLRKKLEASATGCRIATVHKKGYILL